MTLLLKVNPTIGKTAPERNDVNQKTCAQKRRWIGTKSVGLCHYGCHAEKSCTCAVGFW
jgi:hypothetical protein